MPKYADYMLLCVINMHQICTKYAIMYRLYQLSFVKYARNMPKYADNMHVYALNMQVYANNMQEICKKYAIIQTVLV